MAKTVKKKAPAKKVPAAKKAAKKTAAAQPAKTAKKTAPAAAPQESFMWRLLKKKEAERKQLQEQNKKSKFDMHATNTQLPTGIQGYTRFAGPRRKAA